MSSSISSQTLKLVDEIAENFDPQSSTISLPPTHIKAMLISILKGCLENLKLSGTFVVEGISLEQLWYQIQNKNDELMKKISKPLSRLLNEADSGQLQQQTTEISGEENQQRQQMSKDQQQEESQLEKNVNQQSQPQSEQQDELQEYDDLIQLGSNQNEEEQFFNDQKLALSNLSQDDQDDDDQQKQEGEQESQNDETLFKPKIKGKDQSSLFYTDMYKSKKQLAKQADKEREIFELALEAGQNADDNDEQEGYVNKDMIQKINQIQQKMVAKKQWQMTGEILAKDRPINSLLAEPLDFNMAYKTDQTNLSAKAAAQRNLGIQQIIRQRIIDDLFDDPIRKFTGLRGDQIQNQKEDILNYEKSTRGLGEDYANDIRRNMAPGSIDPIESQKVQKVHQEIQNLQIQLFRVLDQLADVHYIPIAKKKQADIKIQKVAAFELEQKVPFVVSNESRKAKKQIFDPERQATFVTKSEKEQQENRKARKQKKRVIRAKIKGQEKREKEQRRLFDSAALAKFESRLKYEKQKEKRQGGQKAGGKGFGQLKSVQFFNKMELTQQIAKNDVDKKSQKLLGIRAKSSQELYRSAVSKSKKFKR